MKTQRKRMFLILTTLIMAATVANMTLRGQSQKTRANEGKLTEKQKVHRKLYKDFRLGKKLPELAAETPETEVGVIRGVPGKMFDPDSPRLTFHGYLKNLVRDADAIVIGVINSQSSQLTEDEDFIFTDYDMAVEQILKDNPVASIQSGSDLTITRPGGILQLDNKEVRALDETLAPLKTGSRYILFLKYIPATGSYKAFTSNGSFQINDKKLIKLTQESLPKELESGRDAESLFLDIRNIAVGIKLVTNLEARLIDNV
jgi:hypothetical protein